MSSSSGIITVGHDGEVFLRDSITREFVSAVGRIGGDKKNPLPIPHLPPGFALQEDNVAVEFNIPPATQENEFVANCQIALTEVRRRAREMGLEVAVEPSAVFPEDQLQTEQAQRAGCDPDLDAWSGRENRPPELYGKLLRSSGGHVHIGNVSHLPPFMLARACDLFLSVPLAGLDTDMARRELYGKMGAFRITEYGMEYRTLSNYWLRSPNLMGYVFRGTIRAVNETNAYVANRGHSPDFLMNNYEFLNIVLGMGAAFDDRKFYRKNLMQSYRIPEPTL